MTLAMFVGAGSAGGPLAVAGDAGFEDGPDGRGGAGVGEGGGGR